MRLLIITQKIDEADDVLGFFTSWVKALSKRVDHVDVFCLAKGKYDLPENVSVVSLGKEKGMSKILQAITFYINVLKILPKVNGVFVHMAPEYVRALYPVNLFFRKPIVMWYAHIKVSPVAKWAMDRVNFILTPSKESFSIDSDKIVSTGHGINTEIFKPKESDIKADIISISRISRVKRIETLIEAVRILKSKGREVSVDIYGKPARPEDDAYLQDLKYMVTKYGLGQNISWKGAVANKESPGVYAEHKIFVRMQGGGGFGKTELEAMSMGIPAVLPTDVYKPYLGEFAEGLYFPEDDASALASRLESVLSWSDEQRAQYAKLSRGLVVGKHNIENVASEIVRLIKLCLA